MQMQPPLDNVKEVVACHVLDSLATGHGHMPTLNLEERLAINVFDVEAIAREGEDSFLQHESLRGWGGELLEDAQGARESFELGGHDESLCAGCVSFGTSSSRSKLRWKSMRSMRGGFVKLSFYTIMNEVIVSGREVAQPLTSVMYPNELLVQPDLIILTSSRR